MLEEKYVKDLQDRFISYVKIHTTSDRHSDTFPTTANQFDLLNLLKIQLEQLGICSSIKLNQDGFLIARIPASKGREDKPVIGFMAHVDTSSDAPGKEVDPKIWENYDGSRIQLKNGVVLDPQEQQELTKYMGQSIITSDGTTLLGADDKAGIAEIMTALKYLQDNPDYPHPPLEIIFTPDEETGMGMDRFPLKHIQSKYAYTMDGGEEGEIEAECYTAYYINVVFEGMPIHPGYARGKLVNAITMAATFVSMLPRNESPEATDGRYGNYWAQSINGSVQKAEVDVFIRDFDLKQVERRLASVEIFAKAVEASFPGGKVNCTPKKQYLNMKDSLDQHPQVMEKLRTALTQAGVDIKEKAIRGGTDGARLTELGIPCPNIFAGGINFHSVKEWVALSAMVKASEVILQLFKLWAH